jgi:hypothetical protein
MKLLSLSSPHPDPNLNSANQQRDDYPGLEPIEARLMDHNDLFVLDFGKRQLTILYTYHLVNSFNYISAPTLKTMAITNVIKHKLNVEALPESIRY